MSNNEVFILEVETWIVYLAFTCWLIQTLVTVLFLRPKEEHVIKLRELVLMRFKKKNTEKRIGFDHG